jgi:Tol biopolymer transport system component
MTRFGCMSLIGLMATFSVVGTTSSEPSAGEPAKPNVGASPPNIERFVCSSDRFNITAIRQGGATKLTHSDKDFKPISSPDGKTLVFFRVQTYGDGSFETWRTAICVINTDGTGFRQLTDGKHSDYNPTFMRDGTNRIAFNRYNEAGKHECKIFLTTTSSSPGEEKQVSHPTISSYEWVYSTLKDGRLFVHRIESAARQAYLLTPNPGGLGKYERVQMPSNQYFHKACISPSETRITYMYDQDNNGATYADARIAWAKLDVKARRVYDQVLITDDSPKTIEEYPKWSPDEAEVLYDSNKARGGGDIYQIYAYQLATGKERNLLPDASHNYQFVCLLGLPH